MGRHSPQSKISIELSEQKVGMDYEKQVANQVFWYDCNLLK